MISKEPMHPADILAALKKVNCSAASIARDESPLRESKQLSTQSVLKVIHGVKTSHPIAYAIAAKTGIPTEKMWPGRYLKPPIYHQARKNNNRGRLPRVASL